MTCQQRAQASRNVLGNLLTYPYGYKFRNLPRVEVGGVYPVGRPQFLLIHSSSQALPLHLLPTPLPDHVKAMLWIGDMSSHPGTYHAENAQRQSGWWLEVAHDT